MKNWNELSMTDKNDIIRVAVQNGITTLPEIRERYNEFAEGGTLREEEYQNRMRQVARENWRNWGYRNEEEAYQDQINNPTYDYRHFYANNPGAVNNAETHWPDTYKGALHRTFSSESAYNGVQDAKFNPSGIRGGRWTERGFVPHGESFTVPNVLIENNAFSSGGKIHIKPENRGKFTALKERTGHSASWFKAHGTPAQRKMATFALNARKWKHGDGGNLFYDGGAQESDNARVQLGIVPNLPMDNSAESRFYRDLALLSAMTDEEKKAEEFYNRAHNTGTIAPTDVQARRGWMEVNPISGEAEWHVPTIVSAAPLTEGQRMWQSPAFQLALAPMFDAPFILNDVNKIKYLSKQKEIVDIPTTFANNKPLITNAEWDAAHRAAYETGDIIEGQRLRDAWRRKQTNEIPIHLYRGSLRSNRNTYFRDDNSPVWFTSDKNAAQWYVGHGNEVRDVYVKNGNKAISIDGKGSTYSSIPIENIPWDIRELVHMDNRTSLNTDEIADLAHKLGYNRVNFSNVIDYASDIPNSLKEYPQVAVFDYNNIKLSAPFTFDKSGNLIPLSQRDNFSSNDISFGWLPWILGGGVGTAGYSYMNQDQGPLVEYATGGRLNGK